MSCFTWCLTCLCPKGKHLLIWTPPKCCWLSPYKKSINMIFYCFMVACVQDCFCQHTTSHKMANWHICIFPQKPKMSSTKHNHLSSIHFLSGILHLVNKVVFSLINYLLNIFTLTLNQVISHFSFHDNTQHNITVLSFLSHMSEFQPIM